MGDFSFDGLPPLREVIAAHQISAKKSLGQNFLMDFNITRKIARMAGDIQNHPIVEIGPGPGALTRGLLGEGAKSVLAIERDERLIPILDQIKARYPDRFEYIIGDAMQVDLSQHVEGRYKIVANLPYNVGTELLIRWLTPKEWPPAWDSLTLMFQKEVANRITAQSGSKAYGRLSLLAQWRAQAGIAMDLPAAAFTPPPKVNSAIVHLKALEAPRFEAEPKILERVVAAAFSQRRKMMRASLKSLGLPNLAEVLETADIDPTARGETLSLEDFCRLARTVQGNR